MKLVPRHQMMVVDTRRKAGKAESPLFLTEQGRFFLRLGRIWQGLLRYGVIGYGWDMVRLFIVVRCAWGKDLLIKMHN